jgi:hypothetical protein
MKPYEHPTIAVAQPAPGHYVITGHNPGAVQTAEGQIVPLRECYITPEIPTDLIVQILEDRPDFPPLVEVNPDADALVTVRAELAAAIERNAALVKRAEEAEDKAGALAGEKAALEKERDALLEKFTEPPVDPEKTSEPKKAVKGGAK